MTDLTFRAHTPASLDRISPWFLVFAAWGAALLFGGLPPTLGVAFRDTDDAMRLVQVRDLMAGQGWFDLVQHRLDPANPVPMHWSRLIDAPLALLIRAFGLVADGAAAERLAMATWPALVLLAALLAVRALALRLGGPRAALPALMMLGLGLSMLWQFAPGRIDHHNVQAVLTLWMFATLLQDGPGHAARCGFLTALMLAVGLETLPYALAGALVMTGRCFEGDARRAEARAYGLVLAVAVTALTVTTVPPALWTAGACDSLSLTYAATAAIGGLGLAALASPRLPQRARLACLCGLAGGILALFAAIEPACLKGPFGQVDRRLWPVWLDYVDELKPWTTIFAEDPGSAVIMALGPALGLASAADLLRDPRRRRDWAVLAYLASALLAFVAGCLQIRTMFYANIFALPLIAAAIGRRAEATAFAGGSALLVALAGGLMLSSTTWAVLASAVLPDGSAPADHPPGAAAATAASRPRAGVDDSACQDLRQYDVLARQAPGLVVSPLSLGPFVLAGTPHSVLSAPYHRQSRGIVDGDAILSAPPALALDRLRARGAAYLLLCSRSPQAQDHDGLKARLIRGEAVAGLEPIPTGGALQLYRVAPR
ncbi:hypothetical protein ABEG18_26670 [Alsobacter sp. KACC 23698]|uniref:AcrB/AcrD/AcrF family protein n=1 Tax=Alsobacter sp. KACC 23698 TaxID=3149229 RepID=A0AAU7JFN4_9HYPH